MRGITAKEKPADGPALSERGNPVGDDVTIPSASCPARQELLAVEHAARLLIGTAEIPGGQLPIEQLVHFQSAQRARWQHEQTCETCKTAVTAA